MTAPSTIHGFPYRSSTDIHLPACILFSERATRPVRHWGSRSTSAKLKVLKDFGLRRWDLWKASAMAALLVLFAARRLRLPGTKSRGAAAELRPAPAPVLRHQSSICISSTHPTHLGGHQGRAFPTRLGPASARGSKL